MLSTGHLVCERCIFSEHCIRSKQNNEKSQQSASKGIIKLLVVTFAIISDCRTSTMIRTASVLMLLSTAWAFAPISQPCRSAATTTSTSLQMGLLNRFREKKEIKVEEIKVGASLPDMDIQVIGINQTEHEMGSKTIKEVVGGAGTNLLVGMPGAYTPTCAGSHMPGYVKAADQLKSLGVNTIAVVTTNGKDLINESINATLSAVE